MTLVDTQIARPEQRVLNLLAVPQSGRYESNKIG
jgi:hypothetical protein